MIHFSSAATIQFFRKFGALVLIKILFIPLGSFAQQTDTLKFFSKSFNTEREVYVYTPKVYSYRSDSLKLPVIYILDGQNEWFVEPLLSTVKYLQYTHQIPAAIIVAIPLKNRVRECGIPNIADTLPLHRFITSELADKIKAYGTNGYNVLIGHSFSASFALYSMLKSPEFYKAVIANSPLDQMDSIIKAVNSSNKIAKGSIFISVGGSDQSKDFFHRKNFEMLKSEYPSLFKEIHIYEADYSGHNAVPIVANPEFLCELFYNFSKRYSNLARVNDEYKLISKPGPINQILGDIAASSYIEQISKIHTKQKPIKIP
jgi:predicted alpha/beta superfamily hydrolase